MSTRLAPQDVIREDHIAPASPRSVADQINATLASYGERPVTEQRAAAIAAQVARFGAENCAAGLDDQSRRESGLYADCLTYGVAARFETDPQYRAQTLIARAVENERRAVKADAEAEYRDRAVQTAIDRCMGDEVVASRRVDADFQRRCASELRAEAALLRADAEIVLRDACRRAA